MSRVFSIYAEYGLFDRLTLVGFLPFKNLISKRTEPAGGGLVQNRIEITTSGISDLFGAGRWSVLQNPFVLSWQGGIKIPPGYQDKPSDDGPSLGTGDLDSEVQLLLGNKAMQILAADAT